MSTGAKARRIDWVYSTFPISLATGPLGTLVTLYLIQLNGITLGTIYASLAAAVYNGVGIPASIFWGFATDRIHRRRLLVLGSYAVVGLIMVSYYFDQTTAGTIARYSVISFVSVASATPLNLLIMETETKNRWAEAFARLSMVSGVGTVVGLVVGTVWTEAVPAQLTLLFVPLGFFGLVSAGLVMVMITEPQFVFEREVVAMRRPSFSSRLLADPLFFLGLPRVSDFRRVFRGLHSSLTSYLPLFYISTILFYFSSGLFNTVFVPAMQKHLLSDDQVFAVILVGMVAQTLAFQLAGKYISERPLIATSVQGLVLRGLGYVLMGVSVLVFSGSAFFIPALVLYPLAAGLAFAFYYTSSNTMMFNTVHGKNAGSSLGVYSAVVGVASMIGALISGFISIYMGFYTTFIIAGALLFAAVVIVAKLQVFQPPGEPQPPGAA